MMTDTSLRAGTRGLSTVFDSAERGFVILLSVVT